MKKTYNLIFDTSLVIGSEKAASFPIEGKIENLISKYQSNEHISLNYVFPEPVDEEFKAAFSRFIEARVKKYNSGIAAFNSYFGEKLKPKALDTGSISSSYKKLLKRLRIEILPLPKNLKIKELLVDAANWKVPFSAKDRGFKDRLIIDCLEKNFSGLPKADFNIFFTEDQLLEEGLTMVMGNLIKIHSTVEEFEKEISNILLSMERDLLAVSPKASNFFESHFNENSLREKFPDLFTSPDFNKFTTSVLPQPYTEGIIRLGESFEYRDTGYIERIDEKKHKWHTTIDYLNSTQATHPVDDQVLALSLGTSVGPLHRERKYRITFDIIWRADYDNKKFTNLKVVAFVNTEKVIEPETFRGITTIIEPVK